MSQHGIWQIIVSVLILQGDPKTFLEFEWNLTADRGRLFLLQHTDSPL